jgi:SAM-dependent methyltransferase
MNSDLSCLVDPETRTLLQFLDEVTLVSDSGSRYPIVNGIPRFVGPDNYAQAFGKQWNRFPRTQLDSHTGLSLSEDRLARCLRGSLSDVRGKFVLEAGSGAGRFTEILLKHGAIVHSFDYSNAVEANAENNGGQPALTLVQADIRRIPFPSADYDYVICLGVLQHTPNSEQSIMSLWEMVKPGGVMVIDHYRAKLRNYMPPPIGVAGMLYRKIILALPIEKQFPVVKKIFDYWFPTIWRFRDSKLMQFLISRLSPIVMYYPHFGLRDRDMYYEWMLLDTHDALTDTYKHRRSLRRIRRFLNTLADEVIVTAGGNGVEAYCRKSS